MVANYSYNAWGKLLDIQSYSNGDNIAAINPLRYRGYYYDTELALYYLQSRYYDPEVGRFVNADDVGYLGADGNLIGSNLFAYCLNNPINRTDDGGTFSLPNWAKVAIGVGAIIIGATVVAATGGTAAFAGAFIAGLQAATISGASGAAVGAATNAFAYYKSNRTWEGIGTAAFNGAIDGFLDGFMAGGITFGASISAGVLGKYANGFKIGSTSKPQYGRVNLGYGNPRKSGNTLLSLQTAAGKSFFRIDVDIQDFLHMHYGFTNEAMKIHKPADILYALMGGVVSVKD